MVKLFIQEPVLVIYDGNIVAEKYAPGFDKSTVMLGWSMSKSLTAAMIGILVKENKLSVDDRHRLPHGQILKNKRSQSSIYCSKQRS
jgi:hypothetical protein